MKPLQILLSIFLSAGAIQGMVYGFSLLLKSSKNKVAHKFLAAILLFFSYRLVVEICKLFGYGFYDFWYHIFTQLSIFLFLIIFLKYRSKLKGILTRMLFQSQYENFRVNFFINFDVF